MRRKIPHGLVMPTKSSGDLDSSDQQAYTHPVAPADRIRLLGSGRGGKVDELCPGSRDTVTVTDDIRAAGLTVPCVCMAQNSASKSDGDKHSG